MLGSSSTYITPVRPEPIWLSQADALRLAAGERVGRTVEREVVEADVDQEGQAGGDLLDDLVADLGLGPVSCSRSKKSRQSAATGG
jgi:hypothetical protein